MYSTTIPLVSIDIGKNVHLYGVYRDDDLTPIVAPTPVPGTRAGLAQVTAVIDALLASHALVRLGHEPTGVYYEAWARAWLAYYADALAAGRLQYVFVNPYQVRQARLALLRGRYRKTDALDTLAIARCLQRGEGLLPAYLPEGRALQFAQWASRYRALERERRRLVRLLLPQIDRLWPGALVNLTRFARAHPDLDPPVPLVQSRPLERALVQALLTHCPNPYDVLTFTEADLIAFLRTHVGRGGAVQARRILQVVHQAVLPPPDVAALLATRLAEDWRHYQTLVARLDALATEADALVPDSPAAVLVSIPGVSAFLAARYLAAIGDIHRFPSARAVWTFAGFDPITDASGDARRVGHISKRGDPDLRDTLYLIGFHTARHCPPITATYRRARARFASDHNAVRAIIHAANAANKLCFRLLRDQLPFDPHYAA